jgi:ribosomal 50S subunit-associated protein YjgA (DUF615 family)
MQHVISFEMIGTVIYFDPCGRKSLEEIKKYLRKNNNLFKTKSFNKKTIQPKLSNVCGQQQQQQQLYHRLEYYRRHEQRVGGKTALLYMC